VNQFAQHSKPAKSKNRTPRIIAASREQAASRRKLIVFGLLACVLILTSLMLHAISGPPMNPDAANILTAPGYTDSLDTIFDTRIPVQPNRWQYVFVHQSKTPGGTALSLARGANGPDDHFVIGNGDGCTDGELQMGLRWNRQLSAVAPVGADQIDPACVSICVVGDFELAPPTPLQLARLGQLVITLESRFHISPDHVIFLNDQAGTPAGVGRYFPATAFHRQLYTKATVN